MKTIIASKIIIELKDGEFENGLILYKVKDGNRIEQKQKSLSIKNMDFPKLHLSDIIDKIINQANEIERR